MPAPPPVLPVGEHSKSFETPSEIVTKMRIKMPAVRIAQGEWQKLSEIHASVTPVGWAWYAVHAARQKHARTVQNWFGPARCGVKRSSSKILILFQLRL